MSKVYIATLKVGWIWDFTSVSDVRVKAVSQLITEVLNFSQHYEGLGSLDPEHLRKLIKVRSFDLNSVSVNDRFRIDNKDLAKEPI